MGNERGRRVIKSSAIKRRIRWTVELHEKFESAVKELGGAHEATPKGILDLMQTPEVTIMHVKSHLQKYRLTITANVPNGEEDSPSDSPQPVGRSVSRGLKDNTRPRVVSLVPVDANEPRTAAQAGMPFRGDDQHARNRLIDTLAQQFVMAEELKSQIMVQMELQQSLQGQRRLLEQHHQACPDTGLSHLPALDYADPLFLS